MKRLRILSVIFLIMMIMVMNTSAQDCGAERFYISGGKACTDYIEPLKCINLDITQSYDFDGLEMEFMWKMGDGQTQEGLEIKHCYQKPGKYEASLTVTDLVTKVVMEDELQVDVFIRGEFSLGFNEMEPKAGAAFVPDYTLSFPDNFTPTNYFWSLGDGRFECGTQPEVVYYSANRFPLILNVELVDKTDTVYMCAQKLLDVKLPDPTGGDLEAYFDQLKVSSRFLQGSSKYQILENLNGVYNQVNAMDSMKVGPVYSLLVFKGNFLIESDPFRVGSSDTNLQKYEALKAAAQTILSKKPTMFKPVIFELNATEFSKKVKKSINANVLLLQKYSFLQVLIGSYTHTGGSYSRNITLSNNRTREVRDYMVEAGIEASRLIPADPSDQRALINTCVTKGCDYEDESLNRRTDFKIMGLNVQGE
ncbi:PKD domain-containing protein [Marinoscillum sp.]|uniref:PKD domain-containing protein n=1 Tax=Marinoscillum sp. TaxID=2024838 RepID=UPI003BA95632